MADWAGAVAAMRARFEGAFDAAPVEYQNEDPPANPWPPVPAKRVGDIIRATGLPDASNVNRNLRVAALSANKITTAETLVANAVADNSCTLTRPGKRLINPATLLESYFTVEEFEGDIDESTVVQDAVWGSINVC
jgi:hypothetical protein